MEQEGLLLPFRQLAEQCLSIFPELNQLYLDQMALIGQVNAQNLFKIHQDEHCIDLLNGLLNIQLYTPQDLNPESPHALAEMHIDSRLAKAEALEEFFQDIYFLTGDLKPQHSLFYVIKPNSSVNLLLIKSIYGLMRLNELLIA